MFDLCIMSHLCQSTTHYRCFVENSLFHSTQESTKTKIFKSQWTIRLSENAKVPLKNSKTRTSDEHDGRKRTKAREPRIYEGSHLERSGHLDAFFSTRHLHRRLPFGKDNGFSNQKAHEESAARVQGGCASFRRTLVVHYMHDLRRGMSKGSENNGYHNDPEKHGG